MRMTMMVMAMKKKKEGRKERKGRNDGLDRAIRERENG